MNKKLDFIKLSLIIKNFDLYYSQIHNTYWVNSLNYIF
jgi:hypothetical protein